MPVVTFNKPELAQYVSKTLAGLTNDEIAGASGVSAEYIRRIKRYGRVPSESILKRIASAFPDKIDEATLLTIAGYRKPETITIEVDGIAVHVCAETEHLPREAIEQITAIVRRIVKEQRDRQ